MNKNVLLTLMFCMVFISFASAQQQSLGTFKSGECVNLIQTCSDCTYNIISNVLFPNSSIAITNASMDRDDTYYNYSFCNTSTLGIYIVNGYGDLGGVKTAWNYDFEITTFGQDLDTSKAIVYLILIIAVFLFFLLTLWGGIALPFKNRRGEEGEIISTGKLKYFKVGLIFMSYVLFIWLANLLFTLANSFNILTQYTKFFEVIFSVMNSASYPIFVFMLILMSAMAWKDLQLKKLLTRGISKR